MSKIERETMSQLANSLDRTNIIEVADYYSFLCILDATSETPHEEPPEVEEYRAFLREAEGVPYLTEEDLSVEAQFMLVRRQLDYLLRIIPEEDFHAGYRFMQYVLSRDRDNDE